jgi:hypothetical protein
MLETDRWLLAMHLLYFSGGTNFDQQCGLKLRGNGIVVPSDFGLQIELIQQRRYRPQEIVSRRDGL